jgi:hypothetical protein
MKSQMRVEFEAWHGFEVSDDMDIQTSVAWDNWKTAWIAATAHARPKEQQCDHIGKPTGMYEPFDTACEKCGEFCTETPNA